MLETDGSIPSAAREFRREWRVLLVATLGCSAGVASLFFYSVGLFITPLEAEFGWSRTALSSGGTAASLSLALLSPIAGMLIDRIGARPIATASLAALAAGFWAMSATPNSLTTYLSIVIATTVLASGCSPLVFTRVIAGRFHHGRGAALGITIAGTGVGAALLPRLLPPYISDHGWRAGYQALALVVLAVLPFVLLFLDGGRAHATTGPAVPSPGIAARDAARTRAFAAIALLLGLGALGVTGVTVHLMPMLTDAGLSPRQAGGIVSLIGVAIIAGRLCTGLLVDRFHASYVAAGLMLGGAMGAAALAFLGTSAAAAAALLVGFAMGAEGDLMGYLVSRYFGFKAYGVIFGYLYAIFLVGAALGPALAGTAFDTTGAYTISLLVSAAAMTCAAIAGLLLGPYPPDFLPPARD